jgi:hypothetical protein
MKVMAGEGGLFTKKFELYFKGSPSTSSGQARKRPHPLAAPSSLAVPFRNFMRRRGLRPRKKSIRQRKNQYDFSSKENAKI